MAKKNGTKKQTAAKTAEQPTSDGPGFWDVVAGVSMVAGAVAFGAAIAPTHEERRAREERERERREASERLESMRTRTVIIETAPAIQRTVVVNDASTLQGALASAYAQLDNCAPLDFTRRYDLEKRIRKLERMLGV